MSPQPLNLLRSSVESCRSCPHGSTRTQVVFDRGDEQSPLAFVGEAPGADEDAQGLPFVGSAGQLLDKQLGAMSVYASAIGIKDWLREPYVCNALKCRPPENKLLRDGSDVRTCSDWLFQQLRLLPNLRVVVTLGRVASQVLLDSERSIGELREWSARERGLYAMLGTRVKVFPTYHPSYLLRQPNRRDLDAAVWADLKMAVEALRIKEEG